MRVAASALAGLVALAHQASVVEGTIANPESFTQAVCDGSVHDFRLVGSTHGSFVIEAETGFPVRRVRDTENGCSNFVYIELQEIDDDEVDWVDTTEVVTEDSAETKLAENGGEPHDWRADLWNLTQHSHHGEHRRRLREMPTSPSRRQLGAVTGSLKNLVILIRWADHTDRCEAAPADKGGLPTQEEIDVLMNADAITTDADGK